MKKPENSASSSSSKIKGLNKISKHSGSPVNEESTAKLKKMLETASEELDRGEGITIESKDALNSLFNDIKG